jgi:hypothetical protein
VAVAEVHVEVVAAEHHEDGVASATVADVAVDVEGSAAAVVAAVASQEAEAVVDSHEVVAAVDVDAEATRVSSRLTWSFCATLWSILSLFGDFFECHDYYQPIPRSSFDGVLELRRNSCKRSDMWRHAGNCLRRLLGARF